MKIRKHKNNKTFRIAFKTRIASHPGTYLPLRVVFADGSCKQSVRRAFLFGRDASNTLTSIGIAWPIPIFFIRPV